MVSRQQDIACTWFTSRFFGFFRGFPLSSLARGKEEDLQRQYRETKMKIKALSRSMDVHGPSRSGDAPRVSHNLDPALHPFSKPREYTRALNAAKLERMHAKPFVGALEGHSDGVYCLAKDPQRLGVIASGAGDGEIRLWDMPTQTLLTSYPRAHQGIVSSVVISPLHFSQQGNAVSMGSSEESNSRMGARRLLSCSTDRTIKLWDADPRSDRLGPSFMDEDEDEESNELTSGGGILGGSNPWKTDADRSEVSRFYTPKVHEVALS